MCRLSVSESPVANELGTARSTVAPFGTRPDVGTLTVTLEPSFAWAPKPLTTRLPWAMP